MSVLGLWPLALCLVSLLLALAAPLLEGEPAPVVHVRWRTGTSGVAQQAAERQLGLTEAERLDERSFRYALTINSSREVRALVTHPDVEDTHYVDRFTFSLPKDGPRSRLRYGVAYRLGFPNASRYARYAALWCLVAAVILRVRAPGAALLRRVRLPPLGTRIARFLIRGIPHCSAEGAGLFRIVFMLLMVPVFSGYALDLDGFATAPYRAQGLFEDWQIVRWMLGEPQVVVWFERILMLLMVIVASGLVGRWALCALIAGLAWWMVLRSQIFGHHPLSVLLLTLLCLVPARWNDALTVSRSRREILPPGFVYGYAVWIPTFVLGVAFAAAAYSKLEAGPAWILNGTVRYHFVVDAPRARVDWGLWIATRPAVAVVLSAAAVMIEAGLITAAFSRSAWYRIAAGGCGLALFVGFYLFQGERWLAWWLLLLGFLPWQAIGRTLFVRVRKTFAEPRLNRDGGSEASAPLPVVSGAPPARGLRRVYLFVIIAVAGQQLFVSAFHREIEPLFSAYDMYATTYASTDDFDARTRDRQVRVDASGAGNRRDVTECLERAGRLQPLVAAAETRGREDPGELRTVIGQCYSGEYFDRLDVLAGERRFDWNTGRFVDRYRDRVMLSLALGDGRRQP